MQKKAGYQAIDAKRADMGVSKQAMADKLNLSWEGLNKKLSGNSEFTLAEVAVIADWWGVCIDELIGRNVPSCPLLRPKFFPCTHKLDSAMASKQ